MLGVGVCAAGSPPGDQVDDEVTLPELRNGLFWKPDRVHYDGTVGGAIGAL